MLAYIQTYYHSLVLARVNFRRFGLEGGLTTHHSIKSANLAVCFLGFSIHTGFQSILRSAELGLLASAFDLVSDGRQFEESSVDALRALSDEILDDGNSRALMALLARKKNRALKSDGLERGVDAFRIVVNHLRSESSWSEESLEATGILLQIVDDVLDWRDDQRSGDLNFLRGSVPVQFLQQLTGWDFEAQLAKSVYPAMLFTAIRRAKSIARTLLSEGHVDARRRRGRPFLSTMQ